MTTLTHTIDAELEGPWPDEAKREQWGPHYPTMQPPPNRWRLVLVDRHGNEVVRDYWTGSGIDTATVTPAQALAALLLDADYAAAADTFEEWAEDLGYDTDSRKAHAAWVECCDTLAELAALLELAPGELADLMAEHTDDTDDPDEAREALAARMIGETK